MSSSVSELPESINIILHRPEYEISLETEIAFLKREINRLEHINHELENKYGYESRLNNELIDILRENKINFRAALNTAGRS